MAPPKVHSGARAILKIDNQVAVYATNVSYSITTDFKEIQGIDNSLPDELVPTSIKVEVTCTNFRVPKESASALGLQPTILNHLHQRYINIEIRDRGTNDVILYVPKALLTNRDGQIGQGIKGGTGGASAEKNIVDQDNGFPGGIERDAGRLDVLRKAFAVVVPVHAHVEQAERNRMMPNAFERGFEPACEVNAAALNSNQGHMFALLVAFGNFVCDSTDRPVERNGIKNGFRVRHGRKE